MDCITCLVSSCLVLVYHFKCNAFFRLEYTMVYINICIGSVIISDVNLLYFSSQYNRCEVRAPGIGETCGFARFRALAF